MISLALAQNPYARYKEQAISTATPEKLIIMLFDGAIKFSGQARKAIEEKDIPKANEFLIRCQDIVSELMNSLNMDFEISRQIYSIYEYINYNFLQANIHKDVKYLDEADHYLKEMRATWIEAAKLAKNPKA